MNKKQPTVLDDEKINTHEISTIIKMEIKVEIIIIFCPKNHKILNIIFCIVEQIFFKLISYLAR
jgi:hypothetical protein